MKVIVSKNGFTMARHNGLIVYVGTDDGKVIQEANDYIELYQSKWYRRIKRWFLRLFRKWDNISLETGQYDIFQNINLSSSIILEGNTTVQGKGWNTNHYWSESENKRK